MQKWIFLLNKMWYTIPIIYIVQIPHDLCTYTSLKCLKWGFYFFVRQNVKERERMKERKECKTLLCVAYSIIHYIHCLRNWKCSLPFLGMCFSSIWVRMSAHFYNTFTWKQKKKKSIINKFSWWSHEQNRNKTLGAMYVCVCGVCVCVYSTFEKKIEPKSASFYFFQIQM